MIREITKKDVSNKTKIKEYINNIVNSMRKGKVKKLLEKGLTFGIVLTLVASAGCVAKNNEDIKKDDKDLKKEIKIVKFKETINKLDSVDDLRNILAETISQKVINITENNEEVILDFERGIYEYKVNGTTEISSTNIKDILKHVSNPNLKKEIKGYFDLYCGLVTTKEYEDISELKFKGKILVGKHMVTNVVDIINLMKEKYLEDKNQDASSLCSNKKFIKKYNAFAKDLGIDHLTGVFVVSEYYVDPLCLALSIDDISYRPAAHRVDHVYYIWIYDPYTGEIKYTEILRI